MKTFSTLKTSSPFQPLVQERIDLLQHRENRNNQEAAKQGLSIRLLPGQIRGLDYMAKQLDMSRQALLVELVTTGLQEVVSIWSNSHGDAGQKIYQEIADLMSIQTEDL